MGRRMLAEVKMMWGYIGGGGDIGSPPCMWCLVILLLWVTGAGLFPVVKRGKPSGGKVVNSPKILLKECSFHFLLCRSLTVKNLLQRHPSILARVKIHEGSSME